MKAIGILLAVLGVFVLIGGAAMDTTETRESCVEYDSSWGSGYSCTEYQYSNPFPSIAAMTLGLGMIIGGVVVARRSNNSGGSPTASGFGQSDTETNLERASMGESDSDNGHRQTNNSQSLADQLRERQDDRK